MFYFSLKLDLQEKSNLKSKGTKYLRNQLPLPILQDHLIVPLQGLDKSIFQKEYLLWSGINDLEKNCSELLKLRAYVCSFVLDFQELLLCSHYQLVIFMLLFKIHLQL